MAAARALDREENAGAEVEEREELAKEGLLPFVQARGGIRTRWMHWAQSEPGAWWMGKYRGPGAFRALTLFPRSAFSGV